MVRVASSQIHQLVRAALDSATRVTAFDLKKPLVEIHDGIAAVQQLTNAACLSPQKAHINITWSSDPSTASPL